MFAHVLFKSLKSFKIKAKSKSETESIAIIFSQLFAILPLEE